MAKFELTKTIEARKLNKRTGIPLGESAVTIPCGGIIENLKEDRDLVKFTYLGEPYQSSSELVNVAAAPMQAPKTNASTGDTTRAKTRQKASSAPKLQWEELASSQSQKVMRAKVPGGWLVLYQGSGITFYPDPKHNWDGGSL